MFRKTFAQTYVHKKMVKKVCIVSIDIGFWHMPNQPPKYGQFWNFLFGSTKIWPNLIWMNLKNQFNT